MIYNWKNRNKNSLLTSKEKLPRDKFLDMQINSNNWRKVAFFSCLVSIFLVFGIINISSNNKIQTYIIEKEGNTYNNLGTANNIGYTQRSQKNVTDEEVIYFLFNFINKTRFLTPNLGLYTKNTEEILSFLTKRSSNKMDRYLIETGYDKKIKEKQTVEIIQNTGIKLENNSYQVRWIERTSNKDGKVILEENYMGIFTIKFVEIKEKNNLLFNPLGMVIVDFTQIKEKL